MLSKKDIAFLKSLHTKKHRQEHGLFLAEGRKVSAELFRSGFSIRSVYVTHEAGEPEGLSIIAQEKVITITARDMERISALSTPSEILCVASIPPSSFDAAHAGQNIVPVLDSISDPGNLGTILRLADWFGMKTVLCSRDTVDAWNPKVVQAAMGSLFRVRVCYAELEEVFRTNAERDKLPVMAADLDGEDLYTAELPTRGYLVFGSEAKGLSEFISTFVSQKLTIPRVADKGSSAESLNVSVAAAIVCSEFCRRRK